MTMLLDTNIVSELCRRNPNAAVVAWAAGVMEFSLSAITVEEVAYGLAWRPNARVAVWFERFLQRCPVWPVTLEIAHLAGEWRGAFAAKGIVRSQADLLIAATAQRHGLTLATRNLRDFAGCGIALLDPFPSLDKPP